MGIIRQTVYVGGNRKKVRALIDSGASTSFIDFKISEQLDAAQTESVKFKTATGEEVTAGQLFSSVRFSKNGRPFPISLIITKLYKEKMIIGVDFLQAHDYILEFENDKYKTKEKFTNVYNL